MEKKDLYEGAYVAKDIKIGDTLPMTASSLYDQEGRPQSKPDVLELDGTAQKLVDTLNDVYNRINTDVARKQYQEAFNKNNIDISVDAFFACTTVLIGRKKYFSESFADEERAMRRTGQYVMNKSRSFDEVLNAREMMCGEYGAVAQLFFQKLGLESELFVGQRVAPDKNGLPDNEAEAHTFLVLNDKGKRYVFDQMLDRKMSQGIYPVIRKIPLAEKEWNSFVSHIRPQYEGGEAGVFPAADIFNNHIQYYGVGGTWRSPLTEKNIWPSSTHTSENKEKEDLAKKQVLLSAKQTQY